MIDTLRKVLTLKNKKARENLAHGYHDPVLMEEIDMLSDVLSTYAKFKRMLKLEALEVD